MACVPSNRDYGTETIICPISIRTYSLERSLRPLITQMNSLIYSERHHRNPVPTYATHPGHCGNNKRMIKVISEGVKHFVEAGRAVASENKHLRTYLERACDEAEQAGNVLSSVLSERCNSHFSREKRKYLSTISIAKHEQDFSLRLMDRISPSTSASSQNGADSGVDEDLEEDFTKNDVLHALCGGLGGRSLSDNCMMSGVLKALAAPYVNLHCPSPKQKRLSVDEGSTFTLHDVTRSKSSVSALNYGAVRDYEQSLLQHSCSDLVDAVARVLNLADFVIVEQICKSKNKVKNSLKQLEHAGDFRNFLEIFSDFGEHLVEFARLSGARQRELKDEYLATKLSIARYTIEKWTGSLLTSCKCWYRYQHQSCTRHLRHLSFERISKALESSDKAIKSSCGVAGANSEDKRLTDCSTTHTISILEYWDTAQSFLSQQQDSLFNKTKTLTLIERMTKSSDASEISTLIKQMDGLCDQINANVQLLIDSDAYPLEQKRNIFLVPVQLTEKISKCSTNNTQIPREIIQELRILLSNLKNEIRSTAMRITNAIYSEIQTANLHLSSSRDFGTAFCADLEKLLKTTAKIIQRNIDLSLEDEKCIKKCEETCRIYSNMVEAACFVLGHCLEDRTILHFTMQYASQSTSHLSQELSTSVDFFISCTNSTSLEQLSKVAQIWKEFELQKVRPLLTSHSVRKSLIPIKITKDILMDQNTPNCLWMRCSERTEIAKSGLQLKLVSGECQVEVNRWRCSKLSEDLDMTAFMDLAKQAAELAHECYLFTRGEGILFTTDDLFSKTVTVSGLALQSSSIVFKNIDKWVKSNPTMQINLTEKCGFLSKGGHRLRATSGANTSDIVLKVLTTMGNLQVVMELISQLTSSIHSACLKNELSKNLHQSKNEAIKQTTQQHSPKFRRKSTSITSDRNRSSSESRENLKMLETRSRKNSSKKFFHRLSRGRSSSAPRIRRENSHANLNNNNNNNSTDWDINYRHSVGCQYDISTCSDFSSGTCEYNKQHKRSQSTSGISKLAVSKEQRMTTVGLNEQKRVSSSGSIPFRKSIKNIFDQVRLSLSLYN